MEILAGTQRTLANDMMGRVARFRYRVFVEMLGWDLPCRDGLELDQFDREDTVYLVARKGEEVVGMARLLPTHRPYLLGEVFPQLMGSLPVPRDPEVWEISRFTAVDLEAGPVGGAARQFSSPVAVDLLRSVLKVAAEHGVQRLITVSPLGIERLLRRAGFLAHRAASPMVIDGHPIFACWIEVPQLQSH
ncbi:MULTISPECIES: acyl-homoserine-lactone synthase [Betaproteobacteria]|jgi:acyl homoserine lactone synthase|uniref:Acyl-homoserine-lactone synthase n=1 Tax=Acidovorax facilis TaxID=12917 RepID=A0ABV8D8Q4_9BURK|nr:MULTISPECIES: acyl-homoserine-lactone synthase [Acidovorax]KQB59096.1 N-acylhomoserine lactone synthase [Acidovorax sp. SD340]MBO1006804.1 GNAT family N-acetyltransferase [Acidovorax sp. SD340]MCO4240311.1 GNAT family N-acetyltransferase [Acidovorax facilis]